MLTLLLNQARAIEGLEQITITVTTGQLAATNLYKSLGFISFGCELRALKVDGRYLDEEYLSLRLT
jgi:RimJ/RimL family protein N-acetyltransferase